jgi:hypothetical protein
MAIWAMRAILRVWLLLWAINLPANQKAVEEKKANVTGLV